MENEKQQIIHELKSWPEAFGAIMDGDKRHETRVNDRDFKKGDLFTLKEYDPETGEYTGGWVTGKIEHIDYGPAWGIPEGYCVFTIHFGAGKARS